MYFETFVIKLRLIPSAGLTIVNKEVVPSLFSLFLLYDCLKGRSKYITKHSKHLMYSPLRNYLVLFFLES